MANLDESLMSFVNALGAFIMAMIVAYHYMTVLPEDAIEDK